MKLSQIPDCLIPKVNSVLPFGYTQSTKNQVKDIMNNGIVDEAPRRKLVEGITIDGPHSLDLDDGIWVEKTKKGGYVLFVSIADPSEYFEPFSPIDQDAMNKGTSVYLDTDIIYMIPGELATDIVSLNHNEKRLSQTVQIEYDSDINVIGSNVYESVFYNKKRYDYVGFQKDYFNEGNEFHEHLRLFDELGTKLRANRLKKGAINFNDAERGIGKGNGDILGNKNIAQRLIEEFMVAANVEIAKFQEENYEEMGLGLFRNHMTEFKGSMIIPDEFERAFYSNNMVWHHGLKEDSYTHFTSPMRRYLDLLLHRQLKAHLRGADMPYSSDDLRLIVNKYLNQQLNRIYYLEKAYYFKQKINSKLRRINSQNETDTDYKLKELKEHIKRGVQFGLRVPKEVKDEIINTINTSTRKGDWRWIIGTYLLSDEKEIIEALRDKILSEPDGKHRAILNSIMDTKLTRGTDTKIFRMEVKNNGYQKINIFIDKHRVVINARTYKEAVEQLFEYALNKRHDV